MIIVGGAKGIRALLTLVASALTVFYILLPLLAKGYNPIGVSLAISAFLTLITFVFTGLSRKVISGLFGTRRFGRSGNPVSSEPEGLYQPA